MADDRGLPALGTELPPLMLPVTRLTAVRYAGAASDFNVIHWSDRAAAALGLPGVIAHGMWTMGASLRVVTDWVGDPAKVRSYGVRFTRPVVIPDSDAGTEVHVTGTVTGVANGVVTVTIDARCGDDTVLGQAVAEVVW